LGVFVICKKVLMVLSKGQYSNVIAREWRIVIQNTGVILED